MVIPFPTSILDPRVNHIEQLEFKLEKIIGIKKHAGKVRKSRCCISVPLRTKFCPIQDLKNDLICFLFIEEKKLQF